MKASLLDLHRLQFRQATLHLDGVSLKELAKAHGTPTYVYSGTVIRDRVATLKKALGGLDATICFAVKANSNISILKLLHSLGVGADLVSGGELERAIQAGIAGNQIVFSGVGKKRDEIERALKHGIHSFNSESIQELDLLESVAARMKKTCVVALRFNPDVDAKTHPYISTGLRDNKFGLEKSEVLDIVKRARDWPHLRIDGLSVHIGSQMLSLSPIRDAFQITREMIERCEAILGRSLSFVDVGGGLGICYKNEREPDVEKYAALIKKNFGNKKIYLEPGRWVVGNAGVLLTEVLARKARRSKDFLIVDAAMNDLMRPALYESHHEVLAIDEFKKGSLKKTDVVGPVCETGDFLAKARSLPTQLKTTDLVAILSAGAYGASMSSQYNSRPRAAEVLVDRGSTKLIRRRETLHDLIKPELF